MKTKNSAAKGIQGFSIWGALIIGLMAMLVLLIVIKLTPVYLNNYQIKTSLEGLIKEPNVKNLSKPEFRELFTRRLTINNVRNVNVDKLEVNKSKGGKVELRYFYQETVHMAGNIDAVVSFDNRAVSD